MQKKSTQKIILGQMHYKLLLCDLCMWFGLCGYLFVNLSEVDNLLYSPQWDQPKNSHIPALADTIRPEERHEHINTLASGSISIVKSYRYAILAAAVLFEASQEKQQ